MARDALTITSLSNLGISQPAQLLGVAANGVSVTPANDGDLFILEVENKGSATATATVITPATYFGLGVEDVALAVPARVAATFTTAIAGANNDMVFTAVDRGTGGNKVTVQYLVSGLNTPLSVAVTGFDCLVNVATDGAGLPTSTAAQVKTAWDASNAVLLATCANAGGNDGSGVVDTVAKTNLSGGAESVMVHQFKPLHIFQQTNGQVYIDISADNSLYLRCYKY